LITASPTTYGESAGQASAYTALHTAIATAYATATNPATNSKANVEIKNNAKAALLDGPGGARQLVAIIQAFPGTNDDMRAELNVRIPDTDPTPAPVPTTSPDLDILATFGHTIRVRLHESKVSGNTTPEGVKGASVFFFVGDNAPAEISQWNYNGMTTRSTYDAVLPSETPFGSKVWLTAFWFNNRMESGPAATPVSIHLPGGMAQAA
jgi:hypothetical protein